MYTGQSVVYTGLSLLCTLVSLLCTLVQSVVYTGQSVVYTGQSVVYTGLSLLCKLVGEGSSSPPLPFSLPTTRYLVLCKMKPIPLGSFVSLVTGTNGRPGAVASNLYDVSGNFRDRTGSFKRRRTGDERDLDDRFDITRNYPPPSHPPKPNFDVDAIQALMVDASSKAEAIKARNDDPNMDPVTKDFAVFNLSLFALLSAVVEKAVMPLANSPPRPGTASPWRPPPLPPNRSVVKRN